MYHQQPCFKAAWAEHRKLHTKAAGGASAAGAGVDPHARTPQDRSVSVDRSTIDTSIPFACCRPLSPPDTQFTTSQPTHSDLHPRFQHYAFAGPLRPWRVTPQMTVPARIQRVSREGRWCLGWLAGWLAGLYHGSMDHSGWWTGWRIHHFGTLRMSMAIDRISLIPPSPPTTTKTARLRGPPPGPAPQRDGRPEQLHHPVRFCFFFILNFIWRRVRAGGRKKKRKTLRRRRSCQSITINICT